MKEDTREEGKRGGEGKGEEMGGKCEEERREEIVTAGLERFSIKEACFLLLPLSVLMSESSQAPVIIPAGCL